MVFFDRGQIAGGRPPAVFHFAVVLEGGDVVGGGLEAQDKCELVVHLDRRLAETVLDARAFDAGGEPAADFLSQLRGDLVAKKGGDVLGLDVEHGLTGELFIKRRQHRLRAEHQIGGIFDLHQTPVVGLPDHIQHWTALRRVTVEDAMQILWRQCIGQGLCALPIGDPDKGVVSHGKVETGGAQLTRKPAMAIAVELQAKRTPRRHPQIDQAELGIHKVEIIVQAFSTVRAQKVSVRPFVVPRLVAIARLHRRDHMHQARVRPASRQNLGHHVFLTDIALGDVLDGNAGSGGQPRRRLAHPVAQRRGKLRRIVEHPDAARVENPGHPFGEARSRQCAGDDDPVVARQNSSEPFTIPIRKQPRHVPLRSAASVNLPLWLRLRRLRTIPKVPTPMPPGSLSRSSGSH